MTAGTATLRTVQVGSRSFAVRQDTYADFWTRVEAGDWEPATFDVLDRFLGPGTVLVDVGAWIGPVTLYAAALGAQCHAFEPDPVARRTLTANVAANPDLAPTITVRPEAIGTARGEARLGNITSETGGDSMSSLLFGDASVGWPVPTMPLADVLDGLGRVDLVKIDIEGAEVELLTAAADLLARRRPSLYLSVHARFWSDPEPRLRTLTELLAPYDVVGSPDGVPLLPEDLLDDEHRRGLFEVLAYDKDRNPGGAASTQP